MPDANVQELHHSHDEDVRLVRNGLGDNRPEHWKAVQFQLAVAQKALDRILSRYDALVAEHDAATEYQRGLLHVARLRGAWYAAHDNAERVMKP